jgi:DNA polymerase III psi subunit
MIGKVSIKNEENIKDIIAFLEKNKLDNFKVLFNNIFNSLKIGDNESFKINFDKLEVLSQNEAENSLIIEKFVFSLKK